MSSFLEQLPNTYRSFFGKFDALTPAQKALIEPILQGRDVVLQAGTGSGKTEGVLAPATENLLQALKGIKPHNRYTILYIVPTKALALDMHRRIQALYKPLGLKAGIRTGDGKTLQDAMPHLLILTPESLDVLLGSQNADNQHFLRQLRIMIIDEVHVFLNNERGAQLSYLRHRLEIQTQQKLQTLALSATLPDLRQVEIFFRLKNPFHYHQAHTRQLKPHWVHFENEEQELIPFFDDLARRFGCQKLLVFANSRKKCEKLYEMLSQEGVFSKHTLLHYSNLSTKERRSIENSFRENRKVLCIATSTLEMGIDIGDVDGVVLFGPPPSTTAFLQRIGRANRREQYVNFWGICHGAHPDHELVRFLALFELATLNRLEVGVKRDFYSVLFQQVLSCLYAKKTLSSQALARLLPEKADDVHMIFNEMVEKNWLKAMPQAGLFSAGWRYVMAIKKQQIWSNFPSTEIEYDVVLDEKTLAIVPLSIVKQLEIGKLVQLAGKVLRVLQIEEKQALREVVVEEVDSPAELELFWVGFGVPTSFEVAQQMGAILLSTSSHQGLFRRTQKLLKKGRESIDGSVICPSGMRAHRLKNGLYRYETFLGSIGNYILYQSIKEQCGAHIEGLSIQFDELGLTCNVWISFARLNFPTSILLFQEWVAARLPLLKATFLWNNWLHALPPGQQCKEITSYLLDIRLLEHFKRYYDDINIQEPILEEPTDSTVALQIELKGRPWSIEDEKREWGKLVFSEIPLNVNAKEHALTARQLQGYVDHALCPRWARLQHVGYSIKSHSRFGDKEKERQARIEESAAFKKRVIEHVQKRQRLCRSTEAFTWKAAIHDVIAQRQSCILVRASLEIDGFKGSPDFIYIKHEGSKLCMEIWDIKNSESCHYAHKWRVAFYVFLLERLLEQESFTLPITLSRLGGVIHRHVNCDELFDRTAFLLAPYSSFLPRLIAQWETNAGQASSVQNHALASHCTSCSYFSSCYQEALFQEITPDAAPPLSTFCSLGIDSNDFPKNSKQWFFLCYHAQGIRWQCWEDQEDCCKNETVIALNEYANWNAFQEAVVGSLQRQWNEAVREGRNPHILVYTPADWHNFQNAFKSTRLSALWGMHVCWTSLQTLLKTHFTWPIVGTLTAAQVARCLNVPIELPHPLSLYHRDTQDLSFDLYRHIWNWIRSYVKSRRVVRFEEEGSPFLISTYLATQHREKECNTHDILTFQKNPLKTRVEQFRAIGPCTFLETTRNGRQKSYHFSIEDNAPIAKFRVGDFLKLSPAEGSSIQEGFSVILEAYSPEKKRLIVRPIEQQLLLNKQTRYTLDENATDWNASKVEKVLNRLKEPAFRPELLQMLLGKGKTLPPHHLHWAEHWASAHREKLRLNPLQQQALLLPFQRNIGLIEGPPGTGKTHLLIWTLIALVSHAETLKRPIKILVTAQTHHAIDQILTKIAPHLFFETLSLWKYGRYEAHFEELGIRPLRDQAALHQALSMIVGATGYGIYQLLEGKNFPQLFDWVVFDEASQVLPSYALLSLIFGKGNALFYGDTQQLPPILKGCYDWQIFTPRSVLQELITKYDKSYRLRLNETYRMNETICTFASTHWYEGDLKSAVPHQPLELMSYPLFQDLLDQQLNPCQSMSVIQIEHEGCREASPIEALWIAKAVQRLIQEYGIPAEVIGIMAPHRLQNNTIIAALKELLPSSENLPRVDTVERMQGLEFDIVFFSATVSDKEMIHSAFLKDYRRFNVMLTRARKKIFFVASHHFFQSFPMSEKELIAHRPFENLFNASDNPNV